MSALMFRPTWALGLVVGLAFGSFGDAGAVCVAADPVQTTVTVQPPPQDCHYVFYPDGSRDRVRVLVVLQDPDGNPICDARVEMSLFDFTGTLKTCPEAGSAVGFTNDLGAVTLSLGKLCGCGTFRVRVTSRCPSDLGTQRTLAELGPFPGTSPDLNGSCPTEARPVNVIDLGIWANCADTLERCCDYNCDGAKNVIDLGIWAGALDTGCI